MAHEGLRNLGQDELEPSNSEEEKQSELESAAVYPEIKIGKLLTSCSKSGTDILVIKFKELVELKSYIDPENEDKKERLMRILNNIAYEIAQELYNDERIREALFTKTSCITDFDLYLQNDPKGKKLKELILTILCQNVHDQFKSHNLKSSVKQGLKYIIGHCRKALFEESDTHVVERKIILAAARTISSQEKLIPFLITEYFTKKINYSFLLVLENILGNKENIEKYLEDLLKGPLNNFVKSLLDNFTKHQKELKVSRIVQEVIEETNVVVQDLVEPMPKPLPKLVIPSVPRPVISKASKNPGSATLDGLKLPEKPAK